MLNIRNSFNVILIPTFIIFFAYNKYSLAASNGSLGSTSIGDLDISILKTDVAHISDINDIDLGAWSGSGNMQEHDSVCVYTDNAGGAYNISAQGNANGVSNEFKLADAISNTLAYGFYWNDQDSNSGYTRISNSGDILTGQSGADTSSIDCNGGADLNARMRIRITQGDLQGGYVGSYSGTVTVTVSGE